MSLSVTGRHKIPHSANTVGPNLLDQMGLNCLSMCSFHGCKYLIQKSTHRLGQSQTHAGTLVTGMSKYWGCRYEWLRPAATRVATQKLQLHTDLNDAISSDDARLLSRGLCHCCIHQPAGAFMPANMHTCACQLSSQVLSLCWLWPPDGSSVLHSNVRLSCKLFASVHSCALLEPNYAACC